MSRLKKILLGTGITILVVVALFLTFIGPWPTYSDSKYRDAGYYKKALADLDQNVKESEKTDSPGPLQAGWSARIMTPKIGTPLGGYGARNGKPSTGVQDELYVKALALSDGKDTVVFIGSDMLLVPPNVAEMVRIKVAEQTPLTANDLYFTASHTHCGPGAWAPGIAGYMTGGKYDPALVDFLAESFSGAIVEAYQKLKPAKLAVGSVDASDYIRNRAREALVDGELSYMIAEQEDGNRCYMVSFSAHPTNYDDDMMRFSAEYPGELQRAIERATKSSAMYLGGSLGSSSPRSPEGADATERMQKLGQALAQLVLDNATAPVFQDRLDIVSVGTAVGMPSMQMRPVSPKWRLSPLAAKIMGVRPEGWIQGVRIGTTLFMGVPFDFSGEISREWKAWASQQGYDLWTTGFCAAYCGYLSPDRYYLQEPLGYETGFMSWFGPNAEAYFTDLFHHTVEVMQPAAPVAAAAVAAP